MRFCFPTVTEDPTNDAVYGHFASAPWFVIVDTESGERVYIPNCDPSDPLAGCSPFRALCGQVLDGIVVGGAGDESVQVMSLCGFGIYQADSLSISENLPLARAGRLYRVQVVDSRSHGPCATDHTTVGCSHHVH